MNVSEQLPDVTLQVELANLRLVSKNVGASIRACTGVLFCYHDVETRVRQGGGVNQNEDTSPAADCSCGNYRNFRRSVGAADASRPQARDRQANRNQAVRSAAHDLFRGRGRSRRMWIGLRG